MSEYKELGIHKIIGRLLAVCLISFFIWQVVIALGKWQESYEGEQ